MANRVRIHDSDRKLDRAVFRRMLLDPEVPDASIRPYLRIDELGSSAFRPRVIVDVDRIEGLGPDDMLAFSALEEVFDWRRLHRYRRLKRARVGLRIVAQGDSWFRFPFLLDDVVDHLSSDHAVMSLGAAGSVLDDPVVQDALSAAIAVERPDAVLLSVGARELLAAARCERQPALGTIPDLDAMIPDRALTRISEHYRHVAVRAVQHGVGRVIGHSYDYPSPSRGRWLGQALALHGIAGHRAQARATRIAIDRFHEMLLVIANDPLLQGRFVVVDCRGVVPAGEWWDELHPSSSGMAHAAGRFRAELNDLDPSGVRHDRAHPGPFRSDIVGSGSTRWSVDAADRVSRCSEGALLTAIGRQAETMRSDPVLGTADARPPGGGPGDQAYPGLHRLGERIAGRVERDLDRLIGDSAEADELDRERLRSARRDDESGWVAEVAPALSASLGLAPSIAPLVAAVLYRRGVPTRWAEAIECADRDRMSAITRILDTHG